MYLPLVKICWGITLWGSKMLCAYYKPRKCEHVRYCRLELILSIILFLCGMFLKQVPYLLKCFCLSSFGILFLAKDLFGLTPFCLPCTFWIFLLYSKFVLCFLELGKAMIPFLCTYIQSHTSICCTILGEAILRWVEQHSLNWYWILLLFLNMTSVWIIYMESDDPIVCILYSNVRS